MRTRLVTSHQLPLDEAMKPFTMMCRSGRVGAGLPPLRRTLSEASAHCDTPNEAMMPSTDAFIASALIVKAFWIAERAPSAHHDPLSEK